MSTTSTSSRPRRSATSSSSSSIRSNKSSTSRSARTATALRRAEAREEQRARTVGVAPVGAQLAEELVLALPDEHEADPCRAKAIGPDLAAVHRRRLTFRQGLPILRGELRGNAI